MHYYFKKSGILLYVFSVIIAILSLIFFYPVPYSDSFGDIQYFYGFIGYLPIKNPVSGFVNWIMITVLMGVIAAVILRIICVKKCKQIISILYNDCDAKLFLSMHYELIRIPSKWSLKYAQPDYVLLMLNYSVALFVNGEVERAISVCEEIKHMKVFTKPRYYNLTFTLYGSLIRYYCENANIGKAKEYILTLKRYSEVEQRRFQDLLVRNLLDAEFLVLSLEDDDQSALSYYKISLEIATSNYERNKLHSKLSEIYAKLGDQENQVKHLKILAENGNSLHCAIKAREKLDTL